MSVQLCDAILGYLTSVSRRYDRDAGPESDDEAIMSDAVLVNPREYDADLHDVYAAFMWVIGKRLRGERGGLKRFLGDTLSARVFNGTFLVSYYSLKLTDRQVESLLCVLFYHL